MSTREEYMFDEITLMVPSGWAGKKALDLLLEAGVPLDAFPWDVDEPILVHGFVKYTGLSEIKEFVKNWQKRQEDETRHTDECCCHDHGTWD